MRMLTFAKRNTKELLRDPLNLVFLFGFPVVLLLLLSAIQANIPVEMFVIEHLAPRNCRVRSCVYDTFLRNYHFKG